MGKIIVILALCAAGGYAYKKGYFTQWVERAQEGVARQVEKTGPTPQQMDERMRQQREHAERVLAEQRARVSADWPAPAVDPCVQARKNVQETQNWMRHGGSMHNVTQGKKMSENETFDALAKNRQFIESNCR